MNLTSTARGLCGGDAPKGPEMTPDEPGGPECDLSVLTRAGGGGVGREGGTVGREVALGRDAHTQAPGRRVLCNVARGSSWMSPI